MTPEQEEQHEQVQRALAELQAELTERGVPWGVLVAVTHAWAVTEIAAAFGGSVAAERCRAAALRVEGLPVHPAVALARTRPAGRA